MYPSPKTNPEKQKDVKNSFKQLEDIDFVKETDVQLMALCQEESDLKRKLERDTRNVQSQRPELSAAKKLELNKQKPLIKILKI